jgi:4-amino-4-deoxy-L-arabinose transferase-like glycosyltransferase
MPTTPEGMAAMWCSWDDAQAGVGVPASRRRTFGLRPLMVSVLAGLGSIVAGPRVLWAGVAPHSPWFPRTAPAVTAAFTSVRRPKRGKRRRDGRAASAAGSGRSPDRKPPLSRKWVVIAVVALCGISVLAGVLAFDSYPSIIGDNAEFIILARSLAAGNGFRYINHPDNKPATKYPLGFPALLAGWIKIFGDSVVSMKVCVLACYVAAVGLTFAVARKLVGWSYALAAAGLVATSATVVSYSNQVLSDVPYMAFSLVGLYLLLTEKPGRWHLAAGLAICIWALVVRTAGMSLVLAAVVFLFIKGRKKAAFAAIAAAVLVSALWSFRNYALTGEGSRYTEVLFSANPYDPDRGMLTFSGLVSRFVTNARAYLGGMLPVTILPTLIKGAPRGGGGPLRVLVSVFVLIVAGFGGYSLRRRGLLLGMYMLVYFGLYLVWPEVWRSERFMVPVAPVLAILSVWGLKTIMTYFDVRRGIILAACAALVLSNLFTLSSYIRRERGYPIGWVRYLETAQWAGSNTDPASVVLCRKPFLFYLFSERRTIAYPFTHDREAMREYLLEARPNYIVLDDFGGGTSATEVYVVPVLQDMLEYLRLAYETEEPVNKLLAFRPPERTEGS